MVYAALEYRIRETLKKQAATFPSQQGRETVCPTARWVFQYFSGVHVLIISQMQAIALNLNKHHINLLKLFGVEYKELYAGPG